MFKKDKYKMKPVIISAMLLALLSLSVFLILLSRNTVRKYSYIGRADVPINTISVQGTGKITSIPDLANINVGVESQAKTVSDAQKDNTKKMNDIVNALKDMGVVDTDLKTTGYNIWPRYNYNQSTGVSSIVGYTINQSVTVKVRNLDKVGDILQHVGDLGANQVGSVSFTINDQEGLKAQARDKAIADAKEKAVVLFKSIGAKPGRIIGFNESYPGDFYPYYAESSAKAIDIGGGAPAPSIETGSQEIEVNVSLIYELQ